MASVIDFVITCNIFKINLVQVLDLLSFKLIFKVSFIQHAWHVPGPENKAHEAYGSLQRRNCMCK